MSRQILHRGPDEDGFCVGQNVGSAVRQLNIIDLKTGQQRVSNEEGTVPLVYNGEIQNHNELRPRLEAQGHLYEEYEAVIGSPKTLKLGIPSESQGHSDAGGHRNPAR